MFDIINGTFETLGFIFVCTSIYDLNKYKQAKGITIPYIVFFSSWGYWNLFYYPHLGQWFSFIGGVLLAISNTIYGIQIIYYRSTMK